LRLFEFKASLLFFIHIEEILVKEGVVSDILLLVIGHTNDGILGGFLTKSLLDDLKIYF